MDKDSETELGHSNQSLMHYHVCRGNHVEKWQLGMGIGDINEPSQPYILKMYEYRKISQILHT